jgi:UPF0716 protein FxsA
LPLLILAVLIGILVVEISVFVEVGGEIGALNTILLTILTAIAGMALLRHQGLSVLMQAQTSLNAGKSPIPEIMSGILLALAGLFLLIPGFVTDISGFLLFMPPLREFLAQKLAASGRFAAHKNNAGFYGASQTRSSTVIDGEYTVVDPAKEPSLEEIEQLENSVEPNDDSPWSKK